MRGPERWKDIYQLLQHHDEKTGALPRVDAFTAGGCNRGRRGSGIHRQSDEGQHQERR